MKNYYKIMGLKSSANESEIKAAYRLLAKRYHPDVNPGNDSAAEKFADVNEAYETLSDEAKKQEYDMKVNEVLMQRQAAQNAAQNPYAAQNARRPFQQQVFQQPLYGQGSAQQFQQYQQQQAQQQMFRQMTEAQTSGFNKGYEAGFNAAAAKAKAECDTLKNKLTQRAALESKFKEEIAALKKTLDETEVDLELMKAAKAEEGEQLSIELKSMRDELYQAQNDPKKGKTGSSDTVIGSLQEKVFLLEEKNTELKKQLSVLDKQLSEAKSRALKAETALTDSKAEKNKVNAERNYYEQEYLNYKQKFEENEQDIAVLNQSLAQWEEFSKTLDLGDAIKSAKSEWDRTVREEKKRLKETHYGTLGVMYWAFDEEIRDSFKKLVKRYQKKAAEDKAFEEKLFAVNEAFKTLSDPAKRKEYDGKIDVTEQEVEDKRAEQLSHTEKMEKLEQEKGEQEFWAYVEELMYLAQTGDAEAQNTLGELYYYGDELEKDLEQATYWFKEAAKQKNPEGMYNLGICFLFGEGENKDETKGKGFIKQAEKLGSASAKQLIKDDFKL